MRESYPPTVPKMCSDCPWRAGKATPGHLGPHTAKEWIRIAHSDRAVACHQTIQVEKGEKEGSWDHPKIRQCRGIAAFRGNELKNPKHPEILSEPDAEAFASNEDFLIYHGDDEPLEPGDLYGPMNGEESDR